MSDLRSRWRKRVLVRLAAGVVIAAVVWWSMAWSEFNLKTLIQSGPRFAEFFSRLVAPDWGVTALVINATIETLLIALAGTFVSIVLALPIGFLAASNVTPAWISHGTKWVLGMARSVPLIVVALIFVFAVGLGPFAGALAIAFHSIGMLGKFYAEEFETADEGIVNAIRGTGANWLQTLRFGLFPQCVPQVVSFSVYRFEMNFRDASYLGLVGAGGIGYYIRIYIGSFQYEKVAVLLIIIVAVVTLLDQLTFWVRRWVR